MYDVTIIGCGVAGGYLASLLKGLNVLVLEKDKKVILKDSGLVSSHFKEFVKAPLIKSRIKEMVVISPSGIKFSLRSEKSFAYLLDRKRFSVFLRSSARKCADLKYGCVKRVVYNKDGADVITDSGAYKSKIVVGCDGALSIVRRTLGIRLPVMYPGMFVRTKKSLPAEKIEIYANKFFSPDFFSWIIPQASEYGLITAIRPKENLEYFRRRLNLPDGSVYSALIPIGYCRSYGNRTLLVGDACGQTKPLTGGGIIFSLRAARYAAGVIKSAVEENCFDAAFLSAYERMWRKDFGGEIKLQLALRKIYRKLTNKEIDDMFVKFGYKISQIREFDYDKLSCTIKCLPKLELLKFIVPRIISILS